MIRCKFCKSKEYMKSGFAQGVQRYKCKKCKKHFIATMINKKTSSHVLEKRDSIETKVNKFNIIKESILNLLKKFLCR